MVRLCGMLICTHKKLHLAGVNLLGKGTHLTLVPRIFEQDNVVGVKGDGAMGLPFVKKILNDIYHSNVFVMGPLGEKVGGLLGLPGFGHLVIEHN